MMLQGLTALDLAVVYNREEAAAVLRAHGAQHSLLFAAGKGMTDYISAGIAAGAVNAMDKWTGGTALHAAARHGHSATVEVLVETCGAKPELTDKRGMTALALACDEGHWLVAEKLVAPTHAAGALNAVNRDTGETALHAAARLGHAEILEALLQTCGAKPELTDKRGMTALVLACAWGHELVAEKLVAPTQAAGALEVQGCCGCSALLFAEAQKLSSVVDKLHEFGVTLKSHGRPDLLLYLAEVLRYTSVVDKLYEFGVTLKSHCRESTGPLVLSRQVDERTTACRAQRYFHQGFVIRNVFGRHVHNLTVKTTVPDGQEGLL